MTGDALRRARCAGAFAPLSRCHRFSPQGKPHMTTFDDRERAFEAKYSRDEEMAFRMTARRARTSTARSATPASTSPRSTRSEEHTSELQSLMRISYAVFCLTKKKINIPHIQLHQ